VPARRPSPTQLWWKRSVIYQVYVRSFADSNADGVGDLRGLIGKLDYLQWLGVDCLWLSPVTVSPDRDWGYDVSDYRAVQPAFGSLADLDELVADADGRGIKIVLDLVPNHTSDRHAWFQESHASRQNVRRDWYIWRDPNPDGSPPNNWTSAFGGGSAWKLDPPTDQMYLHTFLPEQVDLNWWNPEVRDAFDEIFRFWLDRGVAGFRLDVAHAIVKDRDLRDKPTHLPDKPPHSETAVLVDLDETLSVLSRWRSLVDSYEPTRILLGETWVMDLQRLAQFYGSGENRLHLAFNFPFAFAKLDAVAMPDVVERTQATLPERAWPVWVLSNHDVVRFPTRICDGDERKIRCALTALLTLRGTPVLYYGDELGLRHVDVPKEAERDIAGRDGARTPMPWNGGWSDPWLPLGGGTSVAEQRDDPGSTLSFTRALIERRRESEDLRSGAYERLPAPPRVWAYRRGNSIVVALNLGDDRADFGGRELAPWEAVILDV
jgi:alpha-glucosidase